MGLRIHKAIGWGLTSLAPGEDGQADSRVNWKAEPFKYEGRTGREYLAWLREQAEVRRRNGLQWFSIDSMTLGDAEWLDKFGGEPVWQTVTYSPEYGLPEVLVIRPFVCTDWSRTDDMIDYSAERLSHPDAENWWAPVRGGIHPFEGLFMDAETGESLPHAVVQWVRLVNGLTERGVSDEEARLGLAAAVRAWTPYRSQAEAKARIVPRVPEEVRDLAEYLDLFTDAAVWRQLRPVLYTYWS
jgi:hypothetical protein